MGNKMSKPVTPGTYGANRRRKRIRKLRTKRSDLAAKDGKRVCDLVRESFIEYGMTVPAPTSAPAPAPAPAPLRTYRNGKPT